MRQNLQDITAREFLAVLFRQQRILVSVLVAVVLVVATVTVITPPTYEARTTLLVKFGREYAYHPEVGELKPAIALTPEEVLNSEIQILNSTDLIEQVVETLTIPALYPRRFQTGSQLSLDDARQRFAKSLSVEAVRKSNVIQLSFRHSDPKLAVRALNLLVELYKEKHLKVLSDGQTGFLDKQMKSYEKSLHRAEERLEAYRQSNGVFSYDEQMTLLLRQRADMEAVLKDSTIKIGELQKRLVALRAELREFTDNPDLHTETERGRAVTEGKMKLLALQLREQELLQKYSEDNGQVQDIRRQVQTVKEYLTQEESDIRRKVRTGNTVYLDVNKEIIKTEAERRSLESRHKTAMLLLGQINGEIRRLDRREKGFLDLKRELAENERNYQLYRGKFEETRISSDLNQQKIANISMIQPPSVLPKPVKPQVALNLLIGVVLGLLSGIGAAFGREYLPGVLRNPKLAQERQPPAVDVGFIGK